MVVVVGNTVLVLNLEVEDALLLCPFAYSWRIRAFLGLGFNINLSC